MSYSQLFSFVTWTSIGLMGAAAAVAGQNLGAGRPGPGRRRGAHRGADRRRRRRGRRRCSSSSSRGSSSPCSAFTIRRCVAIGTQLLRVLSVSGLFISAALTYTGGLQGTGDTKSPLYISIVSQIVLPLGICFVIQQTGTLQPIHIWLAILAGHVTGSASALSGSRRAVARDRGWTSGPSSGRGESLPAP